jgi:hypothetical protein
MSRFGVISRITIARHAASPGPLALLNGKLLAAAENAGFDALITVDQNLPKQQNVAYPRTVDRCTERAHNEHKRAHNEHR